MNFTPFGTTFTTGGLPAGHQFATAKFAQQMNASGGSQILGVVNSDDQGITYLRPIDNNGTIALSLPQASGNSQANQVKLVNAFTQYRLVTEIGQCACLANIFVFFSLI